MTEHDLMRMVVRVFDKLSIPCFVTGGMAAIAYGEPRYTSDVDVVADIPLESAAAFVAEFPFPEICRSARRSQPVVSVIVNGRASCCPNFGWPLETALAVITSRRLPARSVLHSQAEFSTIGDGPVETSIAWFHRKNPDTGRVIVDVVAPEQISQVLVKRLIV